MPRKDVILVIYLSPDLKIRMRESAKRERRTLSELGRDAIEEKVEYLEAKQRMVKERQQQEQEAKKERRKVKATIPKAVVANENDALDAIYKEGAKEVLAVIEHTTRRRIAILAVMEKVKKETPLSHPSDEEILKRLEREIVRIRKEEVQAKVEAEATATTTVDTAPPDGLAGHPINSSVRTRGLITPSTDEDVEE
jgi:hypothetical protein